MATSSPGPSVFRLLKLIGPEGEITRSVPPLTGVVGAVVVPDGVVADGVATGVVVEGVVLLPQPGNKRIRISKIAKGIINSFFIFAALILIVAPEAKSI